MRWTVGALLDDGSRGLAQALVTTCLVVVLLLAVAVLVPVAILAGTVPGVIQPTIGRAPVTSDTTPQHGAATRAQMTGAGAVEAMARTYLGIPYVFGGTDPRRGLDCSGLVQLVFRNLGIALPRTAQLQYNATLRLTREQLLPGDLVFFARTYADA